MSNQSPSSSVVSDSDLGDTETVYSESDCHTEDGEWEPDFVDIQDHSKDDEDYNPRKDDVEMVVNIPAPASRAVSRPSTSTSDDAAVAVKAFATLIMKPTLDLLHVDRQPRFLSALKSRCDFQAYKTDIDDAFDILCCDANRRIACDGSSFAERRRAVVCVLGSVLLEPDLVRAGDSAGALAEDDLKTLIYHPRD
ncbi:unnamed protein product [Tilletia controversa]|nr:unnamed protein product [Tilletia controversa]